MDTLKKGIVIACTEASRPFYEDMVKTLKTPYPILFSWEEVDRPSNSHEYGAVAVGKEMFDEFVFLHDSVLIKDNNLFDILFSIPGHVALSNRFFHLMGKFVSKDIPPIPTVRSKKESIANELSWFTAPFRVFPDPLPVESNVFVERHGRTNMLLENMYLTKFKGHWGQPL